MAVSVLARSDYYLYLSPEGSTNADSLPGSVWNGGDVEVSTIILSLLRSIKDLSGTRFIFRKASRQEYWTILATHIFISWIFLTIINLSGSRYWISFLPLLGPLSSLSFAVRIKKYKNIQEHSGQREIWQKNSYHACL